jgi:hypothetical protein
MSLFELLKGTAQGDCPSPIIYNICAQILIFKIELCEGIRKLPIYHQMPVPINNNSPEFSLESNMETSKNESFADDSTTFTYCEYSDLLTLKEILEQFAGLSGLKCNFEKTTVIRIGNVVDPIDPNILNLGFDFSNSCKLLGFVIQNNGDLLESNLDFLKKKTTSTINFWKIFPLSLSGKITIINSVVYPVLNYYLTVLVPPADWIANIQKLIEDFVISNMNIAKNKLYADPGKGGLGLFDPSFFFTALRCSWIKRINTVCHDNWRRAIYNCAPEGNLSLLQRSDTSTLGDLCKGLVGSLVDCRNAFGILHNNFALCPILNNNHFNFRYRNEMICFNNAFFADKFHNLDENIKRSLCWNDLTIAGTDSVKSINQLSTFLGIRITGECRALLISAFRNVRNKFARRDKSSMSFHDFLNRKSKGSKQFRKILCEALTPDPKNPIINYCKIAGVEAVSPQVSLCLNKMWRCNFLSSELKTFLFKLHHNILGLNSRVHHINENREPACFFCTKALNLPAEKETFEHFFWFCPSVNKILTRFFTEYISIPVDKSVFFTGSKRDDDRDAYIFREEVLIIFSLIRFVFWCFKTRKKLPSWHGVCGDFFYTLNVMLKSSKNFNANILGCGWLKIRRE